MTSIIFRLMSQFDTGTLTRRELLAGLTTLAGAGATTSAAAGLKVSRLDHVSLNVSDLQRSRDFYLNVFASSVNSTPRPSNEVRLDLGDNGILVLRRSNPPGTVDHLGVKLEGFDKPSVMRQLRTSGIVPVDDPNVPGTAGFHVVDPDGFKVQLQ
jgi:catechol 2,3-dioxygenase-like lactoylglutathione lyase family enzyme